MKRHARARARALPGDARGRDDTARPRSRTCATDADHDDDDGDDDGGDDDGEEVPQFYI